MATLNTSASVASVMTPRMTRSPASRGTNQDATVGNMHAIASTSGKHKGRLVGRLYTSRPWSGQLRIEAIVGGPGMLLLAVSTRRSCIDAMRRRHADLMAKERKLEAGRVTLAAVTVETDATPSCERCLREVPFTRPRGDPLALCGAAAQICCSKNGCGVPTDAVRPQLAMIIAGRTAAGPTHHAQ